MAGLDEYLKREEEIFNTIESSLSDSGYVLEKHVRFQLKFDEKKNIKKNPKNL